MIIIIFLEPILFAVYSNSSSAILLRNNS